MKRSDESECSGDTAPGRKTRSAGGRGTQTENAPDSEPVTDFLSHLKDLLARSFAGILRAIVRKSIEGSLPHAKYLFDIAGVKEQLQRQGDNHGEPTLADLLLAEVRRQREIDGTISAAEMTTTRDQTNAGNHTVQAESDCGARA